MTEQPILRGPRRGGERLLQGPWLAQKPWDSKAAAFKASEAAELSPEGHGRPEGFYAGD